tara:strand:+ start:189 stop:620 length:432 start_codon:yes stop_codon:yes gene_type:complete
MKDKVLTCDYYNILLIYEAISLKYKRATMITESNEPESSEEVSEDFPISAVSIYIKHGNENPRLVYGGPVINYEARGEITVIDVADANTDKKILIKIDKNDAADITVIDGNENIEDEFIVHGMQLKDPFDPGKLSIIKVEEVL